MENKIAEYHGRIIYERNGKYFISLLGELGVLGFYMEAEITEDDINRFISTDSNVYRQVYQEYYDRKAFYGTDGYTIPSRFYPTT